MALKQQNFDPIVSAKSWLSKEKTGWSHKARESALGRLSNIGLPSHRDEYWKYTNPAELITEKPIVSQVAGLEDANVFSEIDVQKIVFCTSISENTLASSRPATCDTIGFSIINSAGFVYFQYSSR